MSPWRCKYHALHALARPQGWGIIQGAKGDQGIGPTRGSDDADGRGGCKCHALHALARPQGGGIIQGAKGDQGIAPTSGSDGSEHLDGGRCAQVHASESWPWEALQPRLHPLP